MTIFNPYYLVVVQRHIIYSYPISSIMQRSPSRRNIPPQISTLPRHKSEAANYLRMYQMAIEKRRLQQKLDNLDLRREQIHQRLSMLDREIGEITNSSKLQLENPEATPQTVVVSRGDRVRRIQRKPTPKPQDSQPEKFHAFLLEY
ncbi:MAG: hypothetical protein EBE86_028965 [Hormoscilla sp. GUM202]|nr:hypothetical protein [Hormoscilla sp. GUM202]